MATLVMIAEYTLAPGTQAAFEALMRDYARRALDHFDGIQQFDVLLGRDEPNRAMVYEVFADEDAYQAYKTSGWVDDIRERYAGMVTDRAIAAYLRS